MSYKIVKTGELRLPTSEKAVLNITNSKKQTMTMDDVRKLNTKFSSKYDKNNFQYYIRVFTTLSNPITLKGLNDDILNEDMIVDYMTGKVKNISSFKDIYQIQIGYIKSTKPTKSKK